MYGKVHVPQSVADELRHLKTPSVVRSLIERPREWLLIVKDPPDPMVIRDSGLHAGERAALGLAMQVDSPLVLCDDREGRQFADDHSIPRTGTLGILTQAAVLGLLDLELTLTTLTTETNFRSTPAILAHVRAEYERQVRMHKPRPPA